MKIGFIGSGVVAQTLALKFISLGHQVMIGTRDPRKLDEKKNMAGSLREWMAAAKSGRVGTFADAAAFGEVLVNATHGMISVEALKAAGEKNMAGKVLLDTANELDFSKGMPPKTLAADGRCLAEKIQKTFPAVRVVKTLNTVSALVMVAPEKLAGGDHTIFVCGNDADAKAKAAALLKSMGWKDIVDLGGVSAARGPEMLMALWLSLWGRFQTPWVNVKIARN